LAAGQTRSIPSKNIPLINEKKQEIGVFFFVQYGSTKIKIMMMTNLK